MKKTMIIAALVAVGLSVSASAFTFEKSKLTLGVMPVYSMPQGNRGDVLDNSLGLNISGEYVVQDNIKSALKWAMPSATMPKADTSYGTATTT
ncbi:MAG: hypothetical protein WCK76_09590 [Elusimicrobiota bacterium]